MHQPIISKSLVKLGSHTRNTVPVFSKVSFKEWNYSLLKGSLLQSCATSHLNSKQVLSIYLVHIEIIQGLDIFNITNYLRSWPLLCSHSHKAASHYTTGHFSCYYYNVLQWDWKNYLADDTMETHTPELLCNYWLHCYHSNPCKYVSEVWTHNLDWKICC